MSSLFYSQSGRIVGDVMPNYKTLYCDQVLSKQPASDFVEVIDEYHNVVTGYSSFKISPRILIPPSASQISNQVGTPVEFSIKTKFLHKIAHEMLMYSMSGRFDDSDVKITKVMGPDPRVIEGSEANRLTPDIIIRDNAIKRIFVFEGTTRFSSGLLEDAYTSKCMKYISTLTSRMMNPENIGYELRYYVAAASDNTIVTNLELSEDEVNSACVHVKIGQWLFDHWSKLGLVRADEGEKNAQKRQLLDKFYLGCSKLSERSASDFIPENEQENKPFMNDQFIEDMINGRNFDSLQMHKEIEDMITKSELDWRRAEDRNLIEDEMLLLSKKYKAMDEKSRSVGIRSEMKPITIFPDFGFYSSGSWIENQSEDTQSGLRKLWKFMLANYPDDYDVREMEAMSYKVVDTNEKVMNRTVKRNTLNTVKITDPEVLMFLKTQGIGIKKDADMMATNVLKKKHQGKYFTLDTNIADIQALLDDTEWFETVTGTAELDPKILTSLFERANQATDSEFNRKSFDEFLKFTKTRMGRMMYYMDCVAQEVNASLARYNHVDSSEAVLTYKRVKGLNDVLICVRALGPADKSSFSMCYLDNNQSRSPFKQTTGIEARDGLFQATDFVTASRDNINRFLGLTARAFSVLSTCKEVFSKNDWYKHFMMIMMIELNGKQALSADLQQTRYMYMHLLSGNRRFMSPFSLLKKFDDGFRCRLHLFCFKKIVDNFTIMLKARPIPQDIILQFLFKIGKLSKTGILEEMVKPPFFLEGDQLKLMLKSMSDRIEQGRREKDEIDDEQNPNDNDRWVNIRSWVTGEIMERAEDTLSLSVFGYFHEKDSANSRVHSYRRIFTKIIKSEMLLRKSDPDLLGWTSAEPGYEYKEHEFSRNIVVGAAKMLREDLDVKYNKNWKERLDNLWKERLYSESADIYGTLKASANKPDSEGFTLEDFEDFEEAKRKKDKSKLGAGRRKALAAVIEAMAKKYTSENPLSDIESLMNFVREEMDSGVLVDLFEKNQIGKSREIFVLHISFRLLISIVETISRCIGECLDEEMMTKGDLKLRVNEKFLSRTKAEMKNSKINHSIPIISSCDATTWCQRFVMPQFALMLNELVPKEWIKPICFILNMTTKKKLVLPKWLLDDMMKHPDENIYDEQMTELRKQFYGLSDYNDLIRDQATRRILHNESNFMQGIFHYTSSLYHCMILRFLDKMFKNDAEVNEKSIKILTNIKVSSDDSSRYLVAIFRDERLSAHARKLGEKYNCFMRRALRSANIEESEAKTTFCSIFRLEEFNSTYDMWGKIMVPTLKMVSSLFAIDPQPRIDLMLHIMANLLRGVAETGCSLKLLSDLQICQFYAHWCMLGLTTNALFPDYVQMLERLPHTAFGFFPLQPGELPLFGLNFASYLLLRSNDVSMAIQNEIISKGGLEYDLNMNPQTTYSITSGSNVRYKGFLNSFKDWDMLQNYEEWAEKNFQQILSYAKTDDRVEFNMARKIKSPGVQVAFGTTSGSSQYARSVYILQNPVVTIKRFNETIEDGKTIRKPVIKKTSLLNCMRIFIDEMSHNNDYKRMREMINLLYPQMFIYETAIYELNLMKSAIPIKHIDMRAKRILKLEIKRREMRTQISLRDVLNFYWYGKRNFGSTYEYKSSLAFYQSKMPWLSERSLKETLENESYPYSDVMGLVTLIEELEPKGTTVKLLTTVKDRGNLGLLLSNIMMYQSYPNLKLELARNLYVSKTKTDGLTDQDRRRFLDGQLSLVLTSPRISAVKEFEDSGYVVNEVIFNSPNCKERTLIQTLSLSSSDIENLTPEEITDKYSNSNRDLNLSMLKFFSREVSKRLQSNPNRKFEEVSKQISGLMVNALRSLRIGITGSFEREQSFYEDKWVGKGLFSGFIDNLFYKIELIDERIMSIKVSNLDLFRRDCLNSFKRVMALFIRYKIQGPLDLSSGKYRGSKGDAWDMRRNEWVSGYKVMNGDVVFIYEDKNMAQIIESKDMNVIITCDKTTIRMEQVMRINHKTERMVILEYTPNVSNLVLSDKAQREFEKISDSETRRKTFSKKQINALNELKKSQPKVYIEYLYIYWELNVSVPLKVMMSLIKEILVEEKKLKTAIEELGETREWMLLKNPIYIDLKQIESIRDWLIFSLKEKLRFKNIKAKSIIDVSIENSESELGELNFEEINFEDLLGEQEEMRGDYDYELDAMITDLMAVGEEEYNARDNREKFKASILPISNLWNDVLFTSQSVGGFDMGLLVFSESRLHEVAEFKPLFDLFKNDDRINKVSVMAPKVLGLNAPEDEPESTPFQDYDYNTYSNAPDIND